MGKTSYDNMKSITEKLSNSINELENGTLELKDLENLVEDARQLYERLLIVKYKAYETYGEPTAKKDAPVVEKVTPDKIDTEKLVVEQEKEIEEETAFDFSGITEEPKVEQPSFDFSDMSDLSSAEDKIEEVLEPTLKEIPVQKPKTDFYSADEDEDDNKEDDVENSLNSKLKLEDDLSLRKKLQSTPVKDLKAEISIAKKFEYIRFMFEGDNTKYESAIQVLNSCTDGEDAKNKLNEYSTEYNWDLENKSIIKFVELVERRYL